MARREKRPVESDSDESVELLPSKNPGREERTKDKLLAVEKERRSRRFRIAAVVSGVAILLLAGSIILYRFTRSEDAGTDDDKKNGDLQLLHPTRDNYESATRGFALLYLPDSQLPGNPCPSSEEGLLNVGVIPEAWHTAHPGVDFCLSSLVGAGTGRLLVLWVEGRPEKKIMAAIHGTCSRCNPLSAPSAANQESTIGLSLEPFEAVVHLEASKGTTGAEINAMQVRSGLPVRWIVAEMGYEATGPAPVPSALQDV